MGGHPPSAAKNMPISDRATTNSRADRHIDKVVHALAGAELPLADRRGDAVIFQANRKGEAPLKLRSQRKVRKAGKGWNVSRNPGNGVDWARGRYTNTNYIRKIRGRQQGICKPANLGKNTIRTSMCIRSFLTSCDNVTLLIDKRAPGLRSAQVYPDGNLLHVRTKI